MNLQYDGSLRGWIARLNEGVDSQFSTTARLFYAWRIGNEINLRVSAEVFKLYSQAKLGMMREALARLDRQANERGISSTQMAS